MGRYDGLFKQPRSKYWYCRFWIRGQEFRYSTGHTDPEAAAREARRKRVEVESKLGKGGRRPGDEPCLEDWAVDDIKRADNAGHSDGHIRSLRYRWDVVLAHFRPDRLLSAISSDDLEHFCGTRRRAEIRDQTIRRELQCLKRSFALARRRQLHIEEPPEWPKLRMSPKHPKRKGNLRPPEAVAAMLNHLRGEAHDQALLCFLTGLRKEELCRLEYAWVEPAPAGASVSYVLRLPDHATKSGRERLVGLPAAAVAVINRRFAENPGDVKMFKEAVHRKTMATACRKAGLPYRITLRDLRHTHATLALRETGDLTAVRDALGHTDMKMTQNYLSSTVGRVAGLSHAVAGLLDTGSEAPKKSKEAPQKQEVDNKEEGRLLSFDGG